MDDKTRRKLEKLDPNFCFVHGWCKPCNTCVSKAIEASDAKLKEELFTLTGIKWRSTHEQTI